MNCVAAGAARVASVDLRMTSGQRHSGGPEQRRFERLPINLDGLMSISGRAPVVCTVRDFCVGGMFISADPATYAAIKPRAPAVLYFALFVDGVKQDFQIQLVIARAVAKGLGVTFVNADAKALELLGHLAAASAPTAAPETAVEIGRTQQDFAAEFTVVVAPLTELVVAQVKQLCDRFLERADEALFLAARDAGNNVDQNRYLDGQREIRARQKRVRESVPARIETGVSILRNPLAEEDAEAAGGGPSDLSLVDKDEFEEFLVISEIVSELEPEFYDTLFALGRRFTYLANREIGLSALPVGPGVLCNAIAECLKGLQSDRRVIARVYKVLHEVMSANLGRFYDDLNKLLVEHGVLPVIEKDKPVLKKKPSAATGFDAPVSELEQSSPNLVEDELADLMPGPEQYLGRLAPSPAGYPPGSTGAVAPAYPPGMVSARPAAGYPQVAAATPTGPYRGQGGYAVQAAPPVLPPGVYAPPGFGGAPMAAAPGGYSVHSAPLDPALFATAAAPVVHGAMPFAPGAVQAAMPTMPAVAGAMPMVVGGALGDSAVMAYAQTFGSAGGVALPPGWISSGVHYSPPTMQHGYSTAQAQLALRRQLMPAPEMLLSETARECGHYSQTQIIDGLSDLQASFAGAGAPPLLDVEALKRRITDALVSDGAPSKMVGGEAADAIEVVANLFSALLHDALVAKSAKAHLTRLQPSVHKAALIDARFFESSDHPVRRLLNGIAQVRDGKGEIFQSRNARITDLVDRANRQFRDDVGVFEPLVGELQELLQEQDSDYARNIEQVVAACEQQQRVLEERRGQSLESTDQSNERSDLPQEWNKWLERSRQIKVGQRVLMNANAAAPVVHTLVWKEARNNLFVFADALGDKASTLTLQQVAMYLRRGVMRMLDDEGEGPALERAMFGVVDRLHGQVEAQATRDPLTGFLLRRFFAEAIDAGLAGGEAGATKHAALCQISIENLKQINDTYGVETGDGLLTSCAEALQQSLRGKDLIYGRVGGAELGVFWLVGGIQNAYKKLQTALEALAAVALLMDDGASTIELSEDAIASATTLVGAIHPEIVIGITGADDALVQADGLLSAARDACDTARTMGAGSIYVAGSESEQRRMLEQMVTYANKALERQCLILLAQSVVSLADSELLPALHVAISAHDRTGKPIPAHLFAPALLRSKNAADIDLWGFRQTLAWILAHPDALDRYAVVFVPLSSASMKNESLSHLIMTEFMENPVPPGKICFEIPDRDVVDSVAEASELISTLKEFGCRFVLDEFGSGHDNYDYIKRLDVDYVTIKTSFVVEAQKNPKDFAMAKSINELVHFMGKKTIAKQERDTDLGATMREIGVDFLYDLTEQAQLAP